MQNVVFYLLLETSRAFTREIFRGVAQWARLYGSTTLVVSAGHVEQEFPRLSSGRNVGIIARLPTPGVLDAVKNLGVPVVTIEPSLPEYDAIKERLGICEIRSDSEAIVRLGVEHFVERNFQRFAFCGVPNHIWSTKREEAFLRIAKPFGPTFVYPGSRAEKELSATEEERRLLTEWLRSLPKPIGIMACNDDRAAQLLRICQHEEIAVPDRVAVLGVDDDDLVCELATPPLSSVAFDLNRAGYQAAELLWSLIFGETKGARRIDLPPIGVVTRRSTDVVAQDDPLLRKATRFIRNNYRRPIGVDAVARELNVSRRTLERRFAERMKITVADQIDNFRFERARILLLNSKDSVEEIAIYVGFGSIKVMTRVFRLKTGASPAEFRKNRGEIER